MAEAVPAARAVAAALSGLNKPFNIAVTATLDGLAFEGASKRNKPNLKVGAVVYARVSLAHKDMEPELECFDAQTRRAEGFGELKSGFVVRCSLLMCRRCVYSSRSFFCSRLPWGG